MFPAFLTPEQMKRPHEEFREVALLLMWLDMIPHDIGKWAHLASVRLGLNLYPLLGDGDSW